MSPTYMSLTSKLGSSEIDVSVRRITKELTYPSPFAEGKDHGWLPGGFGEIGNGIRHAPIL